MLGVVWDYYSLKLKGKRYKQNTSPKNFKTEIKILVNHGLAWSGFEQPGLEGLRYFGIVLNYPLSRYVSASWRPRKSEMLQAVWQIRITWKW